MAGSSRLHILVSAFCCLPGVGKKSAQRMAYHLLQRDRDGGNHLAQALVEAMQHIGHCKRCRSFSEQDLCHICADPKRVQTELCVVESPTDVQAMEEAGFRGVYFVLMGHLSPLDGIGPEDLGLEQLAALVGGGEVKEVILATNSTVEGEATAHYISEMVKKQGLTISRIAHGVPLGGELEYIDSNTLSHALSGRRELTV
ncbi:MAG: recombination mediator RecR [Gammaproteobacteria bacterium]